MQLKETIDKISRMFGENIDLQQRLAALYTRLSQIEDIRALSQQPGWRQLSDALNQTVENIRTLILELSSDPVKNEKQLMFARANVDAIMSLVSIVEQSTKKHQSIMAEIDESLKLIEGAANCGIPIK